MRGQKRPRNILRPKPMARKLLCLVLKIRDCFILKMQPIIEHYFLDISTLKLMFTSQKKSERPIVSCIFQCRVVDSPRSNDCLLKFTTRKLLQHSNTALCRKVWKLYDFETKSSVEEQSGTYQHSKILKIDFPFLLKTTQRCRKISFPKF